MSLYRVNGPLAYREHQPGETFEAVLDPDVEERAIGRGNITLIERSTPTLRPGSYRPPDGWPIPNEDAPEGAFPLKEA